jgi:hypothetical protein
MGQPTDAETFLRLSWERMLARDPHRGWPNGDADVAAVGRALIAAGLLDDASVAAVADEYALAMALRGNPGVRFMHGFGGGERETLSAQRVALGDFEIDTGDRRIHISKIAFGDDDTSLYATGTQARGGAARHGRPRPGGLGMHMGPPDPGTLALKDDQGTTASAAPQGWGGSDTNWQATFHSDRPLSANTAWIEVEGCRIELPPPGPGATVRVEPVESVNSIAEALYQEILSGLQGQQSLDDFISALVEVGVVAPEAPEIVAARTVAAALENGRPARGVPPPWDAVLKRSSALNGPVGQMPIGAAVESVAGHSIRFDSLTSEAESFSVDVAVSPATPLQVHFPGIRLDGSPITWWAEDDRHNRYIGVANSHGGSHTSAEGTIVFMSPLDPQATVLTLLPTGRDERAVVTIPLDSLRSQS